MCQESSGYEESVKRVMVIGCSGAGKSTLAIRLGRRLGLPVVHLDQRFWKPGWVETPDDEWDERMRELVAEERWVIDGNYGRTQVMRMERADTIIFLIEGVGRPCGSLLQPLRPE